MLRRGGQGQPALWVPCLQGDRGGLVEKGPELCLHHLVLVLGLWVFSPHISQVGGSGVSRAAQLAWASWRWVQSPSSAPASPLHEAPLGAAAAAQPGALTPTPVFQTPWTRSLPCLRCSLGKSEGPPTAA